MSDLSRGTLEFFAELVGRITLSAAEPNLVETATTIETAKRDLAAALAEPNGTITAPERL